MKACRYKGYFAKNGERCNDRKLQSSTGGSAATVGPDTATGDGLVDAYKAVMLAKVKCLGPINIGVITPIQPFLQPIQPITGPIKPIQPIQANSTNSADQADSTDSTDSADQADSADSADQTDRADCQSGSNSRI